MAPQTTSHRQKRQFQPSITSFFSRSDSHDGYETAARQPLQQPVLEASVQSDLLSVGMRIRKAVPEGYKTHKSPLFLDPTPALQTTTPRIPSRPIELLPFCGLHKVGGLSVQGLTVPVDANEPFDIFADERLPFSSQESNISNFSTDSMPPAPMLNPFTTNKRRYLDDDDDNEDIPPIELQFDPLDPLLAGLRVTSPNTGYPSSHSTMPNPSARSQRTMAKPRSRLQRKSVAYQDDVENEMDFEDATFLVPWEDEEFEMGGT